MYQVCNKVCDEVLCCLIEIKLVFAICQCARKKVIENVCTCVYSIGLYLRVVFCYMVSERVEPFMQLRGGVKFVLSIPKPLSGRTLRKEIREKTLEEKQIKPGTSSVMAPSDSEKGIHRKDYGGRSTIFL